MSNHRLKRGKRERLYNDAVSSFSKHVEIKNQPLRVVFHIFRQISEKSQSQRYFCLCYDVLISRIRDFEMSI